ncbi:MAG: GntR family transcriptional regulator [Verrucomicrobiota bacterium]
MASPQAQPSARVPRTNRATDVHLRLRSKIVSGHFPQGSALAEPALAEHFRTSRAPIREALIALEREGLVTFEKTGRTRVRTIEAKDIREIMEARAALESMAAGIANRRWTEADTEFVVQNIEAQEKARSLNELSRLDIDLHQRVMLRSGNARLLQLWEPLRWQYEAYLVEIFKRQSTGDYRPETETVLAHRRLLKALSTETPEEAAAAMMEHVLFNITWAD